MSRRTRTTLPTKASLLEPETVPAPTVISELEQLRASSKHFYDRNAGAELPRLEVGDHVYLKPRPAMKGEGWKYGQVTNIDAPCSYTIQTSSGPTRRNSRHIRVAAPPHVDRLIEQHDILTEAQGSGVWSTPTEPATESHQNCASASNIMIPAQAGTEQMCDHSHIQDAQSHWPVHPSPTARKSARPTQRGSSRADSDPPVEARSETPPTGYITRSGRLSKPRPVVDV